MENELAVLNNFVQEIINEDVKEGKNSGKVHTRFPPEPNGYLHIGHAKSICLNFGLALQNKGLCNLRFDDTNPTKEETEYVDSIMEDVAWLGFQWSGGLYYASDYFTQLYQAAEELIEKGLAFVCELSAEAMREYRGTLSEPGKNSPWRERPIEESLRLFREMRLGNFPDGAKTLRAKIDMASPNLNMRDPVIYRILRADHHRTGEAWCIYPMYDFAHPLSDALEGITHSVCTLEFADHRPLYDWCLANVSIDKWSPVVPQQIEFARLNLTHTVMSKRKLRRLVEEDYVMGWDDPRMPTISGLRRRGYTPLAIRDFCERIGVAKRDSMVDIQLLEHCIREDLNAKASRMMAVLEPIPLVIENWPEGHEEWVEVENNPEVPETGKRQLAFSGNLLIEAEDFAIEPPKGFFRLSPGREVRLKGAYYVTCTGYDVDEATGKVTMVRCSYDPESKGGTTPDGRKVKGTSHWVSATHGVKAKIRLYSHLFLQEDPEGEEGADFTEVLNHESLVELEDCYIEPSAAASPVGERCQFIRQGYFIKDQDSTAECPVFNRIVPLRDSWAKAKK